MTSVVKQQLLLEQLQEVSDAFSMSEITPVERMQKASQLRSCIATVKRVCKELRESQEVLKSGRSGGDMKILQSRIDELSSALDREAERANVAEEQVRPRTTTVVVLSCLGFEQLSTGTRPVMRLPRPISSCRSRLSAILIPLSACSFAGEDPGRARPRSGSSNPRFCILSVTWQRRRCSWRAAQPGYLECRGSTGPATRRQP